MAGDLFILIDVVGCRAWRVESNPPVEEINGCGIAEIVQSEERTKMVISLPLNTLYDMCRSIELHQSASGYFVDWCVGSHSPSSTTWRIGMQE